MKTRAAPAPATRRLAANILRRDKTCKRCIKGKLMRTSIEAVEVR